MSKQKYEPPSQKTTLIQSLRSQPSFLIERYNDNLKKDNESKGIRRAGGVYIPPHKLRALQQQLLEKDPSSTEHQKMMWELLRKSINGIVNKVNISNLQNVVIELFNQNILRGRGLLARAVIKAQMASPNFSHVYAALIAIINTKLPEIGLLILKRVIIQFKRSYERNNKIVCMATTKMIAHLINQRVLGFYAALQVLVLMILNPTDDSIEMACDFMIEVGQILGEIAAGPTNSIYQRFKTLLHEGEMPQKAQYSIENLFAVRKTGFKEHPGVIQELDLVELQDQITHEIDIEDEMKGQQNTNVFKEDPFYLQTEQQWDKIKMEILGEQNVLNLKEFNHYEEEFDEEPEEEGIVDLTEQDLINLRKTIYLAIQSTINFEQCAHKVIKMNIAKGYEHELIDMILECCMMERIYQTFFGLLSERFCLIDDKYKELFITAFINHYNNIFKQEANKIRNLAKLYGHLLHRNAIEWKMFQVIVLKPETTTAAGRMFLKILFKEIAENMGIDKMAEQFNREDLKPYFEGLFPVDSITNIRFAINYYTTIGLGKLTQGMRQILQMHQQMIQEKKRVEQEIKLEMLMKEEEQMMRLMLQEQQKKIEEQKVKVQEKQKKRKQQDQKKKKEIQRREKEKERQKEKKRRQRDNSTPKKHKKQRIDKKRDSRSRSRDKDKNKHKNKYRSRSDSFVKRKDKTKDLRQKEKKPELKKAVQNKKRPNERYEKPKTKKAYSQQSESSGFSSSDSSSSGVAKVKKVFHQAKKSSSSSSSSSSSGSSEGMSQKKKRYQSQSSESIDYQYNKRK